MKLVNWFFVIFPFMFTSKIYSQEAGPKKNFNYFIRDLMNYTQSQQLFFIVDQNYDIYDGKEMLKDAYKEFWVQVHRLKSKSQLIVYLKEHTSNMALIVILLPTHDAQEFLIMVNEESIFLEKISWLILPNNRTKESWNQFNFNISPAMRLFSISHCVDSSISVKFVYYDYVRDRSRKYQIGKWDRDSHLRMRKKFNECCYNLAGMRISVVYQSIDYPFVYAENGISGVRFKGLMGDVFQTMADHFGLKFRKVYKVSGTERNATGILMEVNLGKADVAVGALIENYQLNNLASFSVSLGQTMQTVTYKMAAESRLKFFLKPFSNQCILTISSIVMLFLLVSRFGCDILACGTEFCMITGWGALMKQSHAGKINKIGVVLLHITFIMLGAYLMHYYNSVMISIFSFSKFKPPFTNFNELAQSEQFRILTWNNSAVMHTIKNSNFKDDIDIWAHMNSQIGGYSVSSIEELLEEFTLGNCAYIGTDDECAIISSQIDNVIVMDEHYLLDGRHMAWRKNAPYGNIFNNFLLQMKEVGIFRRIEIKSIQNFNKIKMNEYAQVDHQQCFGLLIILGLGMVIASLVLSIEILYFSRKLNKIDKPSKDNMYPNIISRCKTELSSGCKNDYY